MWTERHHRLARFAAPGLALLLLAVAGMTIGSARAGDTPLQGVDGLRSALRDAVQRKDREALQGLLAADFVYVHSNGRTNNKAERLDSLLTGNAMETQPTEELLVQALDERTAMARGQTRMPARGNSEAFLLKWNAVYLLKDGRWTAAYVQSWR